jgi:glyoxylase-like metal-dependent hydrolase (beta-lactamase superfamily II)
MSDFGHLELPLQFETDELSVYKARENLFILQTRKELSVSIYVLIGQVKAMVIDAGWKVTSLKSVLAKITDKPCELFLTHGHRDHIGAVNEFQYVYCHRADHPLLAGYVGEIREVKSGQTFDIGGEVVEVIELVGHTMGSVGYLAVSAKWLFTGDAIGSRICWMHITRLPLEALLDALRHLENIGDRWTEIWQGHFNELNRPLGMEYLGKLKELVEKLCRSQEEVPTLVDTVSKAKYNLDFDPLIAMNGDYGVIFNPNRKHYV